MTISLVGYHLVVKERESMLNDYGCVPYSSGNTSTTSRDSTNRWHWLQHFFASWIFSNTFESLQLLLHAGIAARSMQ